MIHQERREDHAVPGTPLDTGVQTNGAVRARSDRAAWQRKVLILTIRILFVGGFFLLWEIASGRWIEAFLISSPSKIWNAFVGAVESCDLTANTWVTFQEIGIGFPIGALSGIWVGYMFGRSKTLADVFEP